MASDITQRARYLRHLPDHLYGYANARPLLFIDQMGLQVQVCRRPNEIPEFEGIPILDDIPHEWIKTPEKEVGLGQAGGEVPGDDLPGCRCQGTEIVDHTGESDRPGVTCQVVTFVDEDCVNRLLEVGKPRGNWLPIVNDCWAFVNAVISECGRNPARPGYRQSPL